MDNRFFCRICVEKLSATDGSNIFKTIVNEEPLSSYFEVLFNIKVKFEDGLPNCVCVKCKLAMELSINLRKQAIESDDAFKTQAEVSYEKHDDEELAFPEDSHNFVIIEDTDTEDLSENADTDAVEFLLSSIQKKVKNTSKSYDERKFQCSVCEKKFIKKTNLTDHLKIHAGVKNFKCNICDKGYTQFGNLKSHMRCHTKERPFKCTLCPKKYTQSSALKTHMRSHTNDRSYICDICTKGFTNASDLTKHKKIHSIEKDYLCQKCNQQFTQKIHVVRHIRRMHPFDIIDDLLIKRKES